MIKDYIDHEYDSSEVRYERPVDPRSINVVKNIQEESKKKESLPKCCEEVNLTVVDNMPTDILTLERKAATVENLFKYFSDLAWAPIPQTGAGVSTRLPKKYGDLEFPCIIPFDLNDLMWCPFPASNPFDIPVNTPVLLYDLRGADNTDKSKWKYSAIDSTVTSDFTPAKAPINRDLSADSYNYHEGRTIEFCLLEQMFMRNPATGEIMEDVTLTYSMTITKDKATSIGGNNYKVAGTLGDTVVYSVYEPSKLSAEYSDMFPHEGVWYVRSETATSSMRATLTRPVLIQTAGIGPIFTEGQYPINLARSKNVLTVDEFLPVLSEAMNGTFTKTWDEKTNKWNYTFKSNA